MGRKLVLVTGGARSGKSSFANNLAAKSGKVVLFVATARADDAEMEGRIQTHRMNRPSEWRTLEAPRKVGEAIERFLCGDEAVVLDCLGVLVSNVLMDMVGDDVDSCQSRFQPIEQEVSGEVDSLLRAFERAHSDFVVVTNEVGQGLVPPYPLGRAFRDLIGSANQALAARADEVYLLVAGIPVELKKLSALTFGQPGISSDLARD